MLKARFDTVTIENFDVFVLLCTYDCTVVLCILYILVDLYVSCLFFSEFG